MTPDKGFFVAESWRSAKDPERHSKKRDADCSLYIRVSPHLWTDMNAHRTEHVDGSPRRPLWFTRSTLRKAFALGGCAICGAVRASERKGIHSFLYEGMMSPLVRGNFLDAGGFCLRHFWMAKEIEDETWPAGGIGMAILCEDLMRLVNAGFEKVAAADPNSHRGLFHRRANTTAFRPGHDCMFCHDNAEKEQFLAEVLEELVDEPEFARPLARHGLCTRHGQMALQLWKDRVKRQELFLNLKAHATQLADDLREFIRKHDYQYRDEPRGPEQDSVLRAIQLFVGGQQCKHGTKKDRS
jgi:hypothetical protein